MFWDMITSKTCMNIHPANERRKCARETNKPSETTIILEVPDTVRNDKTSPIGRRMSDLSWLPVTEVFALTCLYLLITHPFG
ncbi:hypothetical protein [Roseovarius sp. EL26]|uniref:hypothetical protein n=1 Tax=Roseovarius sp. EL26 TaxID=2126672 RepID=UPI000EA02A0D|nr:hypothetical protein [Roseovarius sp. EL26]